MKHPWSVSPRVDPSLFEQIRLRMIFDYCKWDPQVGDASILAPFALILSTEEWNHVAGLAENLAAEALAAESELVDRTTLHRELGFPKDVARELQRTSPSTVSRGIARLMRFDFHYTTDGWRISEVNSDVPGGFNEASGLPRLMAEQNPGTRVSGDPTERIVAAIQAGVGSHQTVALVHATAYTDDRQVMTYLSRVLESRDMQAHLVAPDQVGWTGGRAAIQSNAYSGPVAALARFYPGEWLPRLPRRSGWQHFFRDSGTPICNPATALLTQGKRFPLVWDRLATQLDTWKKLLPETRDPGEVGANKDGEWILKPAFGRVGEDVGIRGVIEDKEWSSIKKQARKHHRYWIAQRRFQMVAVDVEGESWFPCLGLYTVDGRVAGAYGRIARKPLINGFAQDIAVLVRDAEA